MKSNFFFRFYILLLMLVCSTPLSCLQGENPTAHIEPPQSELKSQRRIAVFVRHCNYSSSSVNKDRPNGFSREKCFQNLLDTLKGEKGISLVFLYDTFYPMKGKTHFLYQQNQYPVVEYKGGTEASSVLFMLNYALEQNLDPETIIYFLEDDYLHRPNWPAILREAFTLPNISYATLYDHQDKYDNPMYAGLKSEIFHTSSCHWRTTPSTTNTFATLFSTLKKDFATHKHFSSLGPNSIGPIPFDHAKFCHLAKEGSILISSIPGYSSHLEPSYLSPCFNWEHLLESIKIPPDNTKP